MNDQSPISDAMKRVDAAEAAALKSKAVRQAFTEAQEDRIRSISQNLILEAIKTLWGRTKMTDYDSKLAKYIESVLLDIPPSTLTDEQSHVTAPMQAPQTDLLAAVQKAVDEAVARARAAVQNDGKEPLRETAE